MYNSILCIRRGIIMGEAILSRRKGKDIYLEETSIASYSIDVLTSSEDYIAPASTLEVTTYGGGGGLSNGSNNSAILQVTEGEIIPVTIGNGSNTTGGTTSFGTYLFAEGGTNNNAELSINEAYGDRGLGGNNTSGTDGVVLIKYY